MIGDIAYDYIKNTRHILNKDLDKINIFLFVKPTIAINFPAFVLFKHVICINQPFAL